HTRTASATRPLFAAHPYRIRHETNYSPRTRTESAGGTLIASHSFRNCKETKIAPPSPILDPPKGTKIAEADSTPAPAIPRLF
ncbi:hypothetical protein, partial [Paenibacillus thiaminolyticus]|uniref:hypothetical protein n=1 Tax=Paenibacillus thiaminolyticus TaxID=49283 RepID=UPI001C3F7A00